MDDYISFKKVVIVFLDVCLVFSFSLLAFGWSDYVKFKNESIPFNIETVYEPRNTNMGNKFVAFALGRITDGFSSDDLTDIELVRNSSDLSVYPKEGDEIRLYKSEDGSLIEARTFFTFPLFVVLHILFFVFVVLFVVTVRRK